MWHPRRGRFFPARFPLYIIQIPSLPTGKRTGEMESLTHLTCGKSDTFFLGGHALDPSFFSQTPIRISKKNTHFFARTWTYYLESLGRPSLSYPQCVLLFIASMYLSRIYRGNRTWELENLTHLTSNALPTQGSRDIRENARHTGTQGSRDTQTREPKDRETYEKTRERIGEMELPSALSPLYHPNTQFTNRKTHWGNGKSGAFDVWKV